MSINGDANNNTLVGTTGDDIINGFEGDDTIQASTGADQVDGGEGANDRLIATISNLSLFPAPPTASQTYVITSTAMTSSSGSLNTTFANVERVYLNTRGSGDFGDTIDASAFVSTSNSYFILRIFAGNGNDTITGSVESDLIYADLGNNAIDAGGGWDRTAVQVDASSGETVHVIMVEGVVQTVIGGVIANTVVNSEEVWVQALNVGGTVTIDASAMSGMVGLLLLGDNNGTDIIIGSAGDDVFVNYDAHTIGGDVYTGNGGADIFDYLAAVDGMDGDLIVDFDWDDLIDLTYNLVDYGVETADTFIGNAAFSGTAGEYRYDIVGGQTIVQVDHSGDGIADETLTLANSGFHLAEAGAGSNYLQIAGNRVIGSEASESLAGTTGVDLMAGLGGADRMSGLQGDDIYYVDDGGDRISEMTGAGTDRVYSTVSFALGANVEMLTLTGLNAIDGTGNALANTLTGNSANNVLNGAGGADRMIGAAGDDTYVVNTSGDVVVELADQGIDHVNSSVGHTLAANVENLTLTGTLAIAGIGNSLDNSITGNNSANRLLGGGGSDYLEGGAGNDTLDGGAGGDFMVGGLGNDVYVVGANDGVFEAAGEGIDEVRSSVDFGLADDIENLTATGSGDIYVGGNALANVLTGNAGNNYMAGDGGNDTIDGRDGWDVAAFRLPPGTIGTLRVVAVGDGSFLVQLVQEGGASEDVFSVVPGGDGGATVTGLNSMAAVGSDTVSNVEDLHFLVDSWPEPTPDNQFARVVLGVSSGTIDENGFAHVEGSMTSDIIDMEALYPGTGSEVWINADGGLGDDMIIGQSGDNYILGNSGNDTLLGGAGNDALVGGKGDDSIDGGDGIDFATGYGLPAETTGTLRMVEGGDGLIIVQLVQAGGETEDLLYITDIGDGSATVTGVGQFAHLGTDTVSSIDGIHVYVDVWPEPHADGQFLDVKLTPYVPESPEWLHVTGSVGGDSIDLAELYPEATVDTPVNANGGFGDDYILGNLGHNWLGGNAGNDTLDGRAGNDSLEADAGDDTLHGGDGEDYLVGAEGNDTHDGGAGWDIAAFRLLLGTTGTLEVVENVDGSRSVRLVQGDGSFEDIFLVTPVGEGAATITALGSYAHLGTDTVTNVEDLHFYVDNWPEPTPDGQFVAITLVTVDPGTNDTLYGTIGDDVLNGLAGNDVIHGSSGMDQVDGGDNYDRLIFNVANTDLFNAVSGSLTYTITGTSITDTAGSINTSFAGIEQLALNLQGTGDFGDTIDASGYSSTASSYPLRIFAGNGDDLITGSAGSDLIFAGGGNNSVDTGAGYDLVSVLSDSASAATVFITASAGVVQTSQGGVVTNSISNAEEIWVSGSDENASLTELDASGLVGFTGVLLLGDNNGTNISIGSTGTDIFVNVAGATLGNDVYTGNGGTDIYDYTWAVDAMDGDTIVDFDWDDVVDMRFNDVAAGVTLFADQFIGNAAFSGIAGEYRYEIVGSDTLVQVDTDGDGLANETLTIANGGFALAETEPGSNFLQIAGNRVPGTAAADSLTGTSGVDLIDGLAGADTMSGQQGDDIYYVDDIGDRVTELTGAGTDRVNSLVTFTLGANVEMLTLTGLAATNGTGNGLANVITGNSANNILTGGGGSDTLTGGGGNDTLNSGLGADTLAGGSGNDTYSIENIGDVVTEAAGEGADTVKSSVAYTLTDNVEKLSLIGTGAISGTGNTLNNTLTGNGAANVLRGERGNDIISGVGGADDIYGGLGNDRLTGGAGTDDYFFDTALNARFNYDRIVDFSVVDDSIQLDLTIFTALAGPGALAGGAFQSGTTAVDADDRILYDSATGNIYYDADGNGAGVAVLFAQVSAGTALTAADFFAY